MDRGPPGDRIAALVLRPSWVTLHRTHRRSSTMAGRVEATLAELGITLPRPMQPIANYVPYVVTGNLVVVSGQVPAIDGKIAVTGKVAAGLSIDRGKEAARLCFINVLVHLKAACGGDLDRVKRVVRLGGFIASPPEFSQH